MKPARLVEGFWKTAFVACVVLAFGAQAAKADALPGTSLYATGDNIFVRFVSYEAWFTNDLYFFAFVGQDLGDAQFLFTNKTAVPGTEVQLLGSFAAGQEIIFGINVYDRNRDEWYTYYSGPAGNNPDGEVHVSLWALDDGKYTVQVGFEDLWDGGDQDYNDLIFDVSGVGTMVTPEPITLTLLATGLAGIAGVSLRRRRNGLDDV